MGLFFGFEKQGYFSFRTWFFEIHHIEAFAFPQLQKRTDRSALQPIALGSVNGWIESIRTRLTLR
jgi:hypothetical protein